MSCDNSSMKQNIIEYLCLTFSDLLLIGTFRSHMLELTSLVNDIVGGHNLSELEERVYYILKCHLSDVVEYCF